jgi:hypothetical protein
VFYVFSNEKSNEKSCVVWLPCSSELTGTLATLESALGVCDEDKPVTSVQLSTRLSPSMSLYSHCIRGPLANDADAWLNPPSSWPRDNVTNTNNKIAAIRAAANMFIFSSSRLPLFFYNITLFYPFFFLSLNFWLYFYCYYYYCIRVIILLYIYV